MAFQETAVADTFPVAGAIAQYICVTINTSGQVVAAAVGADAIGVTAEGVTAAEFTAGKKVVPVALIAKGGKFPIRVSATLAVAIGDVVSVVSAGEIGPTATTRSRIGIALQAAGVDADQEVITVLLDKGAKVTP